MTTFVVDASVAVKWVLREPGFHAADLLIKEYEAGQVDLIAPRQITEEVASALKALSPKADLQANGRACV